MLSKTLAIALAFSSAVSAAPALQARQNPCRDAYNACIAAGTPEVACSCTLASCSGEDNARNREYCASATASLKLPSPTPTSIPGGCNPAHPGSCPSSYFATVPTPVSTSIPGGCNPAHPGSCPSSYFDTIPVPASTSIPGGCNPAHPGSCPSSYFATIPIPVTSSIPGGCNPAHPGSCPSSYFATVSVPTPTSIPGGCNPAHEGSCPSSYSAKAPEPVATSIPGGCNPAHEGSCPSSYFATKVVPVPTSIPGGCNPAHEGSCPSSYFATKAVPVPTSIPGGCNPAHPGSCPTPSPAPSGYPAAPSPSYVKVGKTWSVANLTRYCAEDNTGCDYNFAIVANGKTERCTVIRMPGSNAATESWSNQNCTTGSEFTVSWGYVTEPAPAFAVMTVVDAKELAWFGVWDVNGQKVTAGNPFGSGDFGNLTEQVYTY
ncbi:Nn.00g012680.m01.CDS01 [Neocucurbitaria sp. VM-36]